MSAFDPILSRWPIFAVLASVAMLAIAHAFETFGGLAPCHLCLKQREVYWVAMGLGGVACLAYAHRSPITEKFRPNGPSRWLVGIVLSLVFLYGAYLAGLQAGAEWKWWPAPETCSSTHASLEGVMALMRGRATATPACDKAAWVFLGISMAGWNFLASLGLIAMSTLSVFRPRSAR